MQKQYSCITTINQKPAALLANKQYLKDSRTIALNTLNNTKDTSSAVQALSTDIQLLTKQLQAPSCGHHQQGITATNDLLLIVTLCLTLVICTKLLTIKRGNNV